MKTIVYTKPEEACRDFSFARLGDAVRHAIDAVTTIRSIAAQPIAA